MTINQLPGIFLLSCCSEVHSIINLIYLLKNTHSLFAWELNDKPFEVECGDGTIDMNQTELCFDSSGNQNEEQPFSLHV